MCSLCCQWENYILNVCKTSVHCTQRKQSFNYIFGHIKLYYVQKLQYFPLRVEAYKIADPYISTRWRCHVKNLCAWFKEKKKHTKSPTAILSSSKFDHLFFVTGHPQCLVMCVHHCLFTTVNVSCWPSWVYRSCEHLLLSVLRHCVPLLQSYGPALVQSLADPAGHWTNSGALPHWFRLPQTLPIAGALLQPDDRHSAKSQTQSSFGKLATQRWEDRHTENEPKIRRKTNIHVTVIEQQINAINIQYKVLSTIKL